MSALISAENLEKHFPVRGGSILRRMIAIGRGIDEQQEPLRPALMPLAVLRADIDGGCRRQLVTLENIGELGRIVGREEDVVAHEIETARPSEAGPCQCRQRAHGVAQRIAAADAEIPATIAAYGQALDQIYAAFIARLSNLGTKVQA